MAARVDERAQAPVGQAPDDGRAPAGIEREPVAGLTRVAAQSGEQRTVEEHPVDLVGQHRRAAEVGRGDAVRRGREVGRPLPA